MATEQVEQAQQMAQAEAMPSQATAPTEGVSPESVPATQEPEIRQTIEEGISQLPDDTKEILAAFSVAPEFAQLMGELLSPDVGQFFSEFADPNMALVAVPREALDSLMEGSTEVSPEAEVEETDNTVSDTLEAPADSTTEATPLI